MRFLEMRRHSLRIRPEEHLSQPGVTLARRVGGQAGPFDLVVSSRAPRAFETAIAMGYAVDTWYTPVDFHEAEWRELARLLPEGMPFVERAAVMRESELAGRYGRALCAQWAAIARDLPEEGRGLVISHGGYLDDSAVACLPEQDYQRWGPNFGHCEGIRLIFDRGKFVDGQVLRVSTQGGRKR
jgi:broad specificity phosphatase PhoE